MAGYPKYIGTDLEVISNIEKLDPITFDGSQSYTLEKNSVAYTPTSANNLQVSIDGVVQAGNFTVSGSTIDFGVAIPATSTNDFIFHYGTGLITTPADGTVTTAKLADSSVSLAKLTATGTKDSTTFLRGDNTFAEAGGGKLLQVVSVVADVEFASTSASYADITEMSASITPSSTSSKILVLAQIANASKSGGDTQLDLRITRDGTAVHFNGGLNDGTSSLQTSLGGTMIHLDSPATTSSVTYKVQLSNRDGNGSVTVQGNNKDGSLTLMEIGA